MVRRRSTVRFRHGAPTQRAKSNLSNRPWEPFREPIGPGSSQTKIFWYCGRLGLQELCDPGGSVLDLLDRAEDHRRGALDGPAHQVPGAVAVTYLGKPLLVPHGLAVRAGGHVAASKHAGERVRRGIELVAQDAGESAFAGFDDGAGVVGDQSAQQGIGVLGVAQVPGACTGRELGYLGLAWAFMLPAGIR